MSITLIIQQLLTWHPDHWLHQLHLHASVLVFTHATLC